MEANLKNPLNNGDDNFNAKEIAKAIFPGMLKYFNFYKKSVQCKYEDYHLMHYFDDSNYKSLIKKKIPDKS